MIKKWLLVAFCCFVASVYASEDSESSDNSFDELNQRLKVFDDELSDEIKEIRENKKRKRKIKDEENRKKRRLSEKNYQKLIKDEYSMEQKVALYRVTIETLAPTEDEIASLAKETDLSIKEIRIWVDYWKEKTKKQFTKTQLIELEKYVLKALTDEEIVDIAKSIGIKAPIFILGLRMYGRRDLVFRSQEMRETHRILNNWLVFSSLNYPRYSPSCEQKK